MKRLLVFTSWYPGKNRPQDFPFVAQQVKVMQAYLPKLSGEDWKIAVWCEGLPYDAWGRLLKSEATDDFWMDENIPVLNRRGVILSHHLNVNQNLLLVGGMKRAFRNIEKLLGGKPDLVWTITFSATLLWNYFQEEINLRTPYFLQEHSVPLKMQLNNHQKVKHGSKLIQEGLKCVVVAERQIAEFKHLTKNARPLVIWNCVDHSFLSESIEKPPGIHLVFVGRLSPQKGLDRLFKALSLLTRDYDELKLHMVGDGELKDSLVELALELKIENLIIWEGSQRPNEIGAILDSCNIFVLPSLYENCPVSLLEAQVKGLACVCTENGASEKVLLQGNGISVADRGDGVALSRGIKEVIDTLAHYDRDNIRKRSIAHFAPEIFAQNMWGVMRGLLK